MDGALNGVTIRNTFSWPAARSRALSNASPCAARRTRRSSFEPSSFVKDSIAHRFVAAVSGSSSTFIHTRGSG